MLHRFKLVLRHHCSPYHRYNHRSGFPWAGLLERPWLVQQGVEVPPFLLCIHHRSRHQQAVLGPFAGPQPLPTGAPPSALLLRAVATRSRQSTYLPSTPIITTVHKIVRNQPRSSQTWFPTHTSAHLSGPQFPAGSVPQARLKSPSEGAGPRPSPGWCPLLLGASQARGWEAIATGRASPRSPVGPGENKGLNLAHMSASPLAKGGPALLPTQFGSAWFSSGNRNTLQFVSVSSRRSTSRCWRVL